MRAGLLKHKISIISPRTTARSTDGAPIVTYTTILNTWAEAEQVGGGEAFRGDYRWADADMKFVIRYSTEGIEAKQNIIFNGSTYNILSVIDSSFAHREMVIMANKNT